ncbi:predicted epimerase, partial [Paenibacillus popilliae ATCC 14706]
TFEYLVVLKRIEADFDDYLHDAWMEHFFIVKEEYKRQTGEEAIDSFKLLEDITGKPLQTYTAEVDEYGDVVSMIPNKPNLKAVENDAIN